MSGVPEVSVIVPVYNVEAYLAECLDSILAQPVENIEIICINDGSTDGSAAVLEAYAERDRRIRIITQTNQGLSAARNAGIVAARGTYLCFVDSDDTLRHDALLMLLGTAKEYKVDIVSYETNAFCNETVDLKQKEKAEYYAVRGRYGGIRSGRSYFCDMVEHQDYVESAWLLFICKSWLDQEKIRFAPGMLYEDAVFSVQCYFRCERMLHLSEKLYNYRIRSNSIMTEAFAYRHAYSRIWVLDEVLRVRYAWAQNEREAEAVARYAIQVAESLKYSCQHMPEAETEKLHGLPYGYDFFVRELELVTENKKYHAQLCLAGLLAAAKKSQRVIVYGAGQIGRKVYDYFALRGMTSLLHGFAVTGRPQADEMMGLPCRSLADWPAEAGTMVIVAANNDHRPEMRANARARGFSRVYPIDFYLETLLNQELGER